MASVSGWRRRSIAAAAVLIACSGPATAQIVDPAVLVGIAELKPLGRQAEFIGRVQAIDKVDLRARVQGFLGPRLFKDGDLVKKDQVLFTIEREPFVAAIDQRKAQVAVAEAREQNAQQQLQRARELAARDTLSCSTCRLSSGSAPDPGSSISSKASAVLARKTSPAWRAE